MDNWRDITPPTSEETEQALWAAAYAKDVCRSYLKDGRPDPEAFMALCSALFDLDMKIIGGVSPSERAEELHSRRVLRGKR